MVKLQRPPVSFSECFFGSEWCCRNAFWDLSGVAGGDGKGVCVVWQAQVMCVVAQHIHLGMLTIT